MLVLAAILAVLAYERQQGATPGSTFAILLNRQQGRDGYGARRSGTKPPPAAAAAAAASVNPVFSLNDNRGATGGSSAAYLEPGVCIAAGVDGACAVEDGVNNTGPAYAVYDGGGGGNAATAGDDGPQYQPIGLDMYGEPMAMVVGGGSNAGGGGSGTATSTMGGDPAVAQYEYVDAADVARMTAAASVVGRSGISTDSAQVYVCAGVLGEAQYAVPMEEATDDVGAAGLAAAAGAAPPVIYAVPVEDGDEGMYHVPSASTDGVYGEYGEVALAPSTPFTRNQSVYAGFGGGGNDDNGVYETTLTTNADSSGDGALGRKASVYAGFGGGGGGGGGHGGGAEIVQVYGSAGEESDEDENTNA